MGKRWETVAAAAETQREKMECSFENGYSNLDKGFCRASADGPTSLQFSKLVQAMNSSSSAINSCRTAASTLISIVYASG
jgi:hypothetical protein